VQPSQGTPPFLAVELLAVALRELGEDLGAVCVPPTQLGAGRHLEAPVVDPRDPIMREIMRESSSVAG
jgi:hypothetical protein